MEKVREIKNAPFLPKSILVGRVRQILPPLILALNWSLRCRSHSCFLSILSLTYLCDRFSSRVCFSSFVRYASTGKRNEHGRPSPRCRRQFHHSSAPQPLVGSTGGTGVEDQMHLPFRGQADRKKVKVFRRGKYSEAFERFHTLDDAKCVIKNR